jgi:hypothetical protein
MRAKPLLRLLAILTLMLAPLSLLPGSMAGATPDSVAAALDLGHCDQGKGSGTGQVKPHVHCSVTAPGVPAGGDVITAQAAMAAIQPAMQQSADLRGLKLKASTPPPRMF